MLLPLLAGCGLLFDDKLFGRDEDEETDPDASSDSPSDSTPDTDASTTPPTDTDPRPCRGTAPQLGALSLYNAGLVPGEEGDEIGLGVEIEVADPDGDLSVVTVGLWIDSRVDGSVNTSYHPIEMPDLVLGDDCLTASAVARVALPIGELDLEYDTHYEIAARIEDAHGTFSEVLVGDGFSPTASGADGGP